MQPFYKTVPHAPSEYFVSNVFNKRNLPMIQDINILCLAFNHAKGSVSSKKCSLLIKQNCERTLVKCETWRFSAKKINKENKVKNATTNVPEKYEINGKTRWTTNR